MSTVQTAASGPGRRWIVAAAAMGLVLISLAAGVWYFAFRSSAAAALSIQNAAQHTTWQGLDDFPSMSPDGNSVAFCSDHNGSFEIYVKSLTPGAREIQLTSDGGQNLQPAWSHDGKYIAYYSKLHGGIWLIPSSGGDVKQLSDFGASPAWSPDDSKIAFQSGSLTDIGAWARAALPPSTLWIVSAKGGDAKQLTKLGVPAGGHGAPAWSPDGKRIAFEVGGYNSSAIWTIPAEGGEPKSLTLHSSLLNSGYSPAFSPDGKSVLYHTTSVMQIRMDPANGEPVGDPMQISSIVQPPNIIRRVSFSADGKKIAYSILRRNESVSSVSLRVGSGEALGSPRPIISNATGRINYPAFSPDGKRLAFSTCSVGGSGCDVWLANTDGTEQTQLTTGESTELFPSWFSGGDQVAFITDRSGRFTYWAIDINTRRERMLLGSQSTLDYVRLSPDGKSVIFNVVNDGVINVWKASLEGGDPVQLTFDKELMGFPAWSPDGKLIAFQVKRRDDTNIMVMPAGGGTPEQLTFDKEQSWIFDWSPDGDKILFAGQRDGYWNAWWVSRSTKKEQQLTDYKKLNSFVRYPSWSPRGDQIAYEYSETSGNIWVGDVK